ncbi:lysine methyltransferase [Nitzschia inconspicua]|uniref:Lysine methyltransferase n=1 Tax=Nitzschia inconspicua TaxID=303405 RepID=A0A9K3L9C9_9STRA|nr:lysine methyltransferase [Nitzschia inconspicua]
MTTPRTIISSPQQDPGLSSSDSKSVGLPKQAHPTAAAFFAALDEQHERVKRGEEKIFSSDTQKKQHHRQQQRPVSASLQKKLQCVGWRNRHSQDDFYPVQIGEYNFTVQQLQRGEVEGTYGTGATVWPAALVMMKYMERHAETLVKGRRVVDLGSGTGVTSVAAAILGAAFVACTDGEESVVQLERDNVRHAAGEINQRTGSNISDCSYDPNVVATIAGCPVAVQKYWWGKDDPPKIPLTVDAVVANCDLVLVADCVLPKLYPIAPLVLAIDDCLVDTSNGSRDDGSDDSLFPPRQRKPCAILAYEHRYYPDYDPREKFRELATERNLLVHTVPMGDMHPIYSVEDIELWIVTRKT